MHWRRALLAVVIMLLASLAGFYLTRTLDTPHNAAPLEPEPLVQTSPKPTLGKDGFPQLSLHMEHATLQEVVDELNRQTNASIAAARVPAPGTAPEMGTFNFDVTGRTLWEIIGLMDDQHLINVHERSGTISLDENARSAGAHAVSGPFFFQVFERPIPQSTPPTLGMQYAFLADPRLKVIAIKYTMNWQITRRGQPVLGRGPGGGVLGQRGGGAPPLAGYTKSGEGTGAGLSDFMQHSWETDVTDVLTTMTASATYTLEGGEQRKAEFQLQVGQPEH